MHVMNIFELHLKKKCVYKNKTENLMKQTMIIDTLILVILIDEKIYSIIFVYTYTIKL